LVEVEEKGRDHYVLDCTQYYASEGVCKLEITQPLQRALKTFAAVIAADALLESGAGR
jgi:hypothetical protein